MEFKVSDRTVRGKYIAGSACSKKAKVANDSASKGLNLHMYSIPPSEDITLMEFDEIAQERLKLLKLVEDLRERKKVGSPEFDTEMQGLLRAMLPTACKVQACTAAEVEKWRRRDVIGHFILRLAFCRSPESTKWLVSQECELFRYRFKNLSPFVVKQFLGVNNIQLEIVSEEEKRDIGSALECACCVMPGSASVKEFYKIDFIEALDLVRRHRVFLRKGMAYVQVDDLASIVTGMLRTNMMAAMMRCFKHLALLEEEGRILPRLARLTNNSHTGKQYDGRDGDSITRFMIDELCASSFPPCMKQIHNRLRIDHHLRHGARRQYGLFLKAIGLSLEEALMFMREEFTKKMDHDKFEKQYAYNIRHMYGKEGRRTEYPAFPCSTIILTNPPAAADCHGCPFKHVEPTVLSQRFSKEGLKKDQIDQILTMTKSTAYDKACTRYFEFTHKMESGALGQLITHPNQYYELSTEVNKGSRTKENHLTQMTSTQTQSTQPPSTSNVTDDDDMDFE